MRLPRTYTESTTSLLGKVLGLVAMGFLLTSAGAVVFSSIPYWFAAILAFANFGLLFAIGSVRNNAPVQVAMLYLFTFIEGGSLGPTIHHHIQRIGPMGVCSAALMTAIGMALVGAGAYLVSIDYRKLEGIALAALIALIVVMIVNLFIHFVHPHTIDYLVLVIFSVLTFVDFARIRAGGDGETAVELALAIYLDALNIFLAILDLMGKGDD